MARHPTPALQESLPLVRSQTISSAPMLAAQLRTLDLHRDLQPSLPPLSSLQAFERLVQVYTIHRHSELQEEARAAVHVVEHVGERLRKLAAAYSHWRNFDAPAYFDLTQDQASQLLQVEERISTARCTFLIDPLLPSFQSATHFFLQQFAPTYLRALHSRELFEHFSQVIQPEMVERWQRLLLLLKSTRAQLHASPNFLIMNAAEEERWYWRTLWNHPPARLLDERLTPPLRVLPTLTLSYEFPLPANRQPGRWRRLWYNRERRRGLR